MNSCESKMSGLVAGRKPPQQKLQDLLVSCKVKNDAFKRSQSVVITESVPALYVCQGEYATVDTASSRLRYIGSSEATTCVLLFLSKNTRVSVAHYDSPGALSALLEQVQSLKGDDGEPIHVSMIGGFEDDHLIEGRELAAAIVDRLGEFPHQTFTFDVCLVGDKNSRPSMRKKGNKEPIFREAVYSVTDHCVLPSAWKMCPAVVPELTFRSATVFRDTSERPLYNIFSQEPGAEGEVFFQPRSFPEFDERVLLVIASGHMSDDSVLENFSTSPFAESDNFVKTFRETCVFLLENPKGALGYFDGKKILRYSLDALSPAGVNAHEKVASAAGFSDSGQETYTWRPVRD